MAITRIRLLLRPGQEAFAESECGRGIYAENSVVAVIALSLFLSAISLMTILQYWRPEKRGTGQISELLEIQPPRRIGRNAGSFSCAPP